MRIITIYICRKLTLNTTKLRILKCLSNLYCLLYKRLMLIKLLK